MQRLLLLLAALILSLPLQGRDYSAKRTFAYLSLGDVHSAIQEGEKAVQLHADSQQAWEAYLIALSKGGREKELMQVWKAFNERFPEQNSNRFLLENMAWGIIENGADSSSPPVRVYALLAAFLGQDARGIKLIRQSFGDSNAVVRSVAAQLASHLRDTSLQELILAKLQQERTPAVRVELVKAVGTMKIKEGKSALLALLASPRTSDEERGAAIASLVNLLEKPHPVMIEKLALSNRAALRELSCLLLLHYGDEHDLKRIYPLLKDCNAAVRSSAIRALAMLSGDQFNRTAVEPLLQDANPQVALTAAWAVSMHGSQSGLRTFKRFIDHPNAEIRSFCAAAMAMSGKTARPLVAQALRTSRDPYQKLNLALGSVWDEERRGELCALISSLYVSLSDKWMWSTAGGFKFVLPSTVGHQDLIPNYPEVVNQMTRLDVVNTLAVMEAPCFAEVVRQFLNEKSWGVTGIASTLLLTEGDEFAVGEVEKLLQEPNHKVKVQAAIILSLWGRGENSLRELEGAYASADRETRERILESIGRVGAKSSVPFLVDRLNEPQQSLRLIASSALLQCLYH